MHNYQGRIDAFADKAVEIIGEEGGLEAAAEFLPSVFIAADDLAQRFDKEHEEVLNDLAEATRLRLYGE